MTHRRRSAPSLWARGWQKVREAWPSTASQRADAVMLLLPVVLVAVTIGVVKLVKAPPAETGVAAGQSVKTTEGSRRALVGLPRIAEEARRVGLGGSIVEALPGALPEAVTREMEAVSVGEPAVDRMYDLAPGLAPQGEARTAGAPADTAQPAGPEAEVAALTPPQDAVPSPGTPGVPEAQPVVGRVPDSLPVPPSGPVTSLEPEQSVAVRSPPEDSLGAPGAGTQCRLQAPEPPPPPRDVAGLDADAFGLMLAEAAREQLDDFIIYNDRYTRLKYPMGDVHPMYGVCTDVVIRAYRALGIDLQEIIQTTRSGSGDPNIDHRRVDTLRKFFERFGEVLPMSSFAEDYRPGDIVTYWRPQNRHSRTHIAIVSDRMSPSGRPLIIHNRGWGPQQEDGLFVDKITGHFRFSGLKGGPAVSVPRGGGAPAKRVSQKPGFGKSSVIRAGLETVPGAAVKAPGK